MSNQVLAVSLPVRQNAVDLKLNQIWVREQGFSLKLKKLKRLEELAPPERLLAAIIRRDAQAARQIVAAHHSESLASQLISLVEKNQLSCFVLDCLLEDQMFEAFKSADEATARSLASQFSAQSRQEASMRTMIDQRFARVLKLLQPWRDHILYVKGIHLCRTIYREPYLRHISDIDIVVNPEHLRPVVEALQQSGFWPISGPAFSNQWGAGPSENIADLFLAPSEEWNPASALSMQEGFGSTIDIKIGPLDRGLQAVESARFFADAETGNCLGLSYFAPSPVDHLMIMLRNLEKDRFASWKTLVDTALLCEKLNQSSGAWSILVERCRRESIEATAVAGLSLVCDRAGSAVPAAVLAALGEGKANTIKYFSFTVSPTFVWNVTSLPMMLAVALCSTDCARKLSLLRRSFLPSKSFLSAYYAGGRELKAFDPLFCIILHWLVLFLPAGIVRRTFGKVVWPQEKQTVPQ